MCGNYTVVGRTIALGEKMGKKSYGEALVMSVLLKKEKESNITRIK